MMLVQAGSARMESPTSAEVSRDVSNASEVDVGALDDEGEDLGICSWLSLEWETPKV